MTKIIINKDGVSRELETPFAICLSSKDVFQLIEELKSVAATMSASGSPYGWHRIDTSHPASGPGGPPRKWTE